MESQASTVVMVSTLIIRHTHSLTTNAMEAQVDLSYAYEATTFQTLISTTSKHEPHSKY